MNRDVAFQLLGLWVITPILALLTALGAMEVVTRAGQPGPEVGIAVLIGCAIVFGLPAMLITNNLLYGHPTDVQLRARANVSKTWQFIILGALPIAIVAIGVGLYALVYQRASVPEGTLAVLLLTGVIGLLTSITVATVFFHGLKLTDRREALGLPAGSVRAIIALSLILIFALMSIYLYSSVNANDKAAASDLAKQLITTVSTLVVAVSAFYFGASATGRTPRDSGAGSNDPSTGSGMAPPSGGGPADTPADGPADTPQAVTASLTQGPLSTSDIGESSSPFERPPGGE